METRPKNQLVLPQNVKQTKLIENIYHSKEMKIKKLEHMKYNKV